MTTPTPIKVSISFYESETTPSIVGDITELEIIHTTLSTLPRLPESLQVLECYNNPNLKNLDYLPSQLQRLECYGCNKLKMPDKLPDTLTYLSCWGTKYPQLPKDFPPRLESLHLGGNDNITHLPTNLPLYLKDLSYCCINTPVFPSAQISQMTCLRSLNCGETGLTMIPDDVLPETLEELICENNNLTHLPSKLPPNLKILRCNGNYLTRLPPLPPTLVYLKCDYNNIAILPDLPDSLEEIWLLNNDALEQTYPNIFEIDIDTEDYTKRVIAYINKCNKERNMSIDAIRSALCYK